MAAPHFQIRQRQRQYQTEKHLEDGQAVPFSFDRVRLGTYSCQVYVLETTRRVVCANVVPLERAPPGTNTMSSSTTMELKVQATTMNIITVTGKTRR